MVRSAYLDAVKFQSTLPVWGATVESTVASDGESVFQSTLPVWGATNGDFASEIICIFQSTLPVWGATLAGCLVPGDRRISIHAPRVGSDHAAILHPLQIVNFNPRSPCGERLQLPLDQALLSLFQSTLPVWGATSSVQRFSANAANFNPRSPCGERPVAFAPKSTCCNFNPRSPCGERHLLQFRILFDMDFNPRSPCGERHRWSRP